MILITGATGVLGKETINFLLKKGYPAGNIIALVRDDSKAADLKASGVVTISGNYDNYNSLLSAMKGVEKVLLVSGNDVVKRGSQHENVVKAAKESGVKHILYTSFHRKNETETSPIAFVAQSHIHTENIIKSSGLTYTILRNNIYLDMLPVFLGKVLETGVFYPAGDAKSAFASRNDMAEATANILAGQGHENKEYNLSNTENISFQDVADILNAITGKTISYLNPDSTTYQKALAEAEVPAEYIGFFAGFAEAIKQGEFASGNTDLEKLLGRKPTSAKEFLTNVYK
ncbi:SDR family oxidoreductase [Chitinophaga tropicalis]|uniref:NAD(P)H-binding protein n=1 Tax=Chitinophaga tropicalis TaxID=2683588 RepID=A0A7K1TX94_9BACT|nr:SDR family oxidoreductase [Chitinophaga tropicalis]MVT06732.1 NAD(P)H-binding protein [Chitinophaga tropicalis]